jgi:hypothetical protein
MARAVALLVVLHVACAASAEEPPPDPSKGESYDGRAHEPTWKDDVLAVPRLILAVPRMILRILFWPIGAGTRWMDKHHVYDRMMAAVTTEDGMIGVRPELSAITGYRTTVGLSFFDDRILGPGSALDGDLGGNIGHVLYTHLHFRPTRRFKPIEYDVDLDYRQRDDYYYQGIGYAATLVLPPSRLGMYSLSAGNRVRLWPSRWVSLDVGGDFVARRYFDGEENGSDRPASQVVCVHRLGGGCIQGTISERLVPGFHEGAQYLRGFAGFTVDSRDSPFRPTSGAMFDFTAAYAHGLGFDDESWFRVHGDLIGVLDLWRRSRVLLLRLSMDMMIPTNDALIPWSEYPQLGGPDDLRGAHIGKYRDFSTLIGSAEYRWPVWMWMDAGLFVDYGGVFGKVFQDFSASHMVTDIGLSLRLRTSYRLFFRGQVAYGFNQGWFFSFTASTNPL